MKTRGLALLLLLLASLSFLSQNVFAVSGNYERDTTIRVDEDGEATVSQTYTITSSDSNELKNLTITIPAENIDNLSVVTLNGTALNKTVTPKNREVFDRAVTYQEVTVTLPALNNGSGSILAFNVNYRTKNYTIPYGPSYLFSFPQFDEQFELASSNVSVLLPLGFGGPHFLGVEPDEQGIESSYQELVFNNPHKQIDGIAIGFGQTQTIELEIKTDLKNEGWLPGKRTFVLPPDLNNQKVSIESIDPKPSNITLDADGNVLAEYFLWPKQSKSVTAKVIIQIDFVRYGSANLGSEIAEQLAIYTKNENYWSKSEIVKKIIQDAGAREQDEAISERINVLSKAVRDQYKLNQSLGFESRLKPSDVEIQPGVASIVYADTLTALLRADGIPARVVVGSIDISGFQSESHAWVEAFALDSGWMTIDPALSEIVSSENVSSLNRVGYFVVDSSNGIPGVLGTTIKKSPTENDKFVVNDLSEAKLTASKLLIFPGLSLVRSTVQIPAGMAQDGLGFLVEDNNVSQLGSLAPLQSKSRWSLSLGGKAFSSSHVKFGALAGGEFIEPALHETDARLNYIIAIIELLVLGIGVFLVIKWRKRGGYKVFHVDRRDDSIDDLNMLKKPELENESTEEEVEDEPTQK